MKTMKTNKTKKAMQTRETGKTKQTIKNKIHFLLLAVFLVVGSSCSDFLDIIPDDVATIETAFENRQNTKMFLFTCYSYMPDPSDAMTYPAYSIDEFYFFPVDAPTTFTQQEMYQIMEGQQSVNSTRLSYWSGTGGKAVKNLFQGIRDCNIFLENIDKPLDMRGEEERLRWAAEVKVIKAYLHYFLLTVYGPVPIIRENLPVSATIEQSRIYREPVDEVIEYIVELLDEATSDLPDEIEDVQEEFRRFTRPIALAIKAKVLATAASPLYNGGVAEFSAYKDNRGKQLISTTYDATKWVRAAEATREAIEACMAYGNRLMDTTDVSLTVPLSTRRKYKILLRDILSKNGSQGTGDNPEVVWAINKGTNTGTKGNYATHGPFACVEYISYMGGCNWNGYFGVTLETAKMFYTDKGIPINEDPAWNSAIHSELVTIPADHYDWLPPGEITARLNLNREPRFYADLCFNRSYLETKSFETSRYILKRLGNEAYSKYGATGYHSIKLTSYTASGPDGGTFVPGNYHFPFIRMSDLYLLYAEALNEVKSAPDNEVYAWIDAVRERAGLKGVVEAWKASSNPSKPTTQAGMRDIIRTERQIELMYEGQRYFDIRRWYIADSYMNGTLYGWNVYGSTNESYYRETVLYNRTYKLRDYFWPIREYDILVNPNLVQSFGW
jgi:hypothetical protein